MKTLNFTDLNEQKVQPVVNELSLLLANFQVFYTNLRGLHWHVKGKGFFHLHAKYEEFYNDASEKVDELAERLLQLGAQPEHRFSHYLKEATLTENEPVSCGKEGMNSVLQQLSALIGGERKVLALANEADDEVTASLMSDYLKEQEKTVWMLNAFLSGHECTTNC